MAKAVLITPEYEAQIRRVVETVVRENRTTPGPSKDYGGRRVQLYQGIMRDQLVGATNALTAPTTGTMEVCTMNFDTGFLETTGFEIEITHRFEHITIEVGTYVTAVHEDGEWHLHSADCNPMGTIPP